MDNKAKIYVVEGFVGLKPMNLVALDKQMAIDIYKQLYEEEHKGSTLIDINVIEEIEIERN